MQNNVTELTQRLLRALDTNYNVIDMPAVIEIVSLLEKITITKELLQTTRLGKHVNELRRKTDDDSLSRRAKELVKKWRNMVLPSDTAPNNGQVVKIAEQPPKRPASGSPPDAAHLKRPKMNGQSVELLELSDNSNSSFKDAKQSPAAVLTPSKRDVILINSDSNSSFPEMGGPVAANNNLAEPKKRGRKKGSKNHKNLLDEAETSFSNKLAVSRGNSKVKTTQELIAGLQNRNSTSPGKKEKEDLNARAAKLTERVSIIDQKLNTNANRYRKLQKITIGDRADRVIESGSVINDKSLLLLQDDEGDDEEEDEEDDVIVVDDVDAQQMPKRELEEVFEDPAEEPPPPDLPARCPSLSVAEALARLPPLFEVEPDSPHAPTCTCVLVQKEAQEEPGDEEVEEEEEGKPVDRKPPLLLEFVEDSECPARVALEQAIAASEVTVQDLHDKCIDNVNGNWGVDVEGAAAPPERLTAEGLYVNVVPNVNTECIARNVKMDFECENFKKYSISEEEEKVEENEEERTGGEARQQQQRVFREWHQVLDTPSYNGEILRVLPYVIID